MQKVRAKDMTAAEAGQEVRQEYCCYRKHLFPSDLRREVGLTHKLVGKCFYKSTTIVIYAIYS